MHPAQSEDKKKRKEITRRKESKKNYKQTGKFEEQNNSLSRTNKLCVQKIEKKQNIASE